MKRLLARLFGGRGAAGESAAAPASAAVPPAAAAAPAASAPPAHTDLSTLDLDLAFFHWLAGPHIGSAPVATGPIFDELARLARDPLDAAGLVPRVPAVIPQLLRSLRDEASSAGLLARQVAQDAMLVAELIREVNSPYYRPATPVRNLEGALLLLGQNGLRMLLARVAFRPIISLQSGPLARQAAPQLWRQSEGCARAAGLLALQHGADPFEAYLAGLMHNIGLVVALRVLDTLASGGGLPDDDAFGTRLLQAARLISGRVAVQWDLPPSIGKAIVQANADGPLGQTLGLADRLAKLHMLAAGGQPVFVRAADLLAPGQRRIYDQLADQDD